MSAQFHILAIVFLVTATLGLSSTARAQTTWYVDDDAPGDPGPGDPTISDPLEDGSQEHPFDAIQEGIDAAVDGDTVLVRDGTYTGDGNKNLEYHGKAITLRSENGPDTCIIDCGGDGRGFCFHSAETRASVLNGLTIQNGYAFYGLPGDDFGGAIYCDDSSPTISNCTLRNCRASNTGGAVCCYGGSPTVNGCAIIGNTAYMSGAVYFASGSPAISHCLIAGNTCSGYGGGGGIRCLGGSPTISNCTIVGNTCSGSADGGGGIMCLESNPIITNCVITENMADEGAGIFCSSDSRVVVANCTIARNAAWEAGGGLSCYAATPVCNCILWDNQPDQIDGVAFLTYCDIQGGWPGKSNIDVDPLLTRDATRLLSNSPCRDAGNPDGDYSGQTDIDGEGRVLNDRVDIGADEWLDTDEDELPDAWEECYFGSPTAADPLADDDGDGLSNLGEYALSRNPLRPPSTFYVDPSGDDDWDGLAPTWDGKHGPKATIQAAIDATHRYEGDEVEIGDGIYTGSGNRNLDLAGKEIVVRSANGPDNCVIDCGAEAGGTGIEEDIRAFYFRRGETEMSVIRGLTLTRASAGAIYCNRSSPVLTDCKIIGNAGPGIYCYRSAPVIMGCKIAANVASHGAGIFCYRASPTIANCAVVGNEATVAVGGIACGYGSPTISNCTIAGNRAGIRAGGVHCGRSSATISNCTIVGNRAGVRGGGLHVANSSTVLLANSLLSDNEAPDGPEIHVRDTSSPSTLTISYSTVVGGLSEIYVAEGCTLNWLEGSIDADPLFVDPDGPDDDPNTFEDNDYRLSAGSPCIDAADNMAVPADTLDLDGDGDTDEPIPFDLDGNPRFVDDPGMPDSGNGDPPIVDMGAYEFQGETCFGDLDGDNDVDLPDLGTLLSNYATTSGAVYTDGDLDRDSDVDLTDLATLLSVYGTTCE